MEFSDLIKKLKNYEKKPNLELIKKAYLYAEAAHKGQKRETGEDFIQHPLNVACILADLKLDDVTIAAALLHDMVEDTDRSKADVVNNFGAEIAELVDAVTKIKSLKNLPREDYHAETLRKVILASIKDLRVLLIKLADRLHNMRTLDIFEEEKRKRISQDVMDVYAPIAHKLGIASIKWELEDLAFKNLEPRIYKEIEKKLKQTQKEREKEIETLKSTLEKELRKTKIQAEIYGRPKHIYSIYKKMQKNDCSFEDIYDILALRIITDSIKHCYEILGIVHSMWNPIPKKFKDYIATPKSNMYQSLHTVVICPAKRPIEIQIRTKEMHDIAEKGVATHWSYKGHSNDKDFDQKFKWMMEVNELQKESDDAKEFLKMLNIDFFEDEIFTFTPKGKVIELPKGASVIDFAYAVHTDLGNHCIAGKVNGLFVPLRATLKSGDRIEIIVSRSQKPSRDWLKFIKTSKAANKIKQAVSITGIPAKRYATDEETKKRLEEWIIDVDSMSKPQILLQKCCKPLPGDKIIGLAKASGKVNVHKADCSTIKKSRGRKTNVRWLDNIGKIAEIIVEAKERVGLIAEIFNTLIAVNTPVKKTHAKAMSDEFIECSFEVETNGLSHLQELIKRVKRIQGVRNVFIGNVRK